MEVRSVCLSGKGEAPFQSSSLAPIHKNPLDRKHAWQKRAMASSAHDPFTEKEWNLSIPSPSFSLSLSLSAPLKACEVPHTYIHMKMYACVVNTSVQLCRFEHPTSTIKKKDRKEQLSEELVSFLDGVAICDTTIVSRFQCEDSA